MQMGEITPFGGANGRDLLAATNTVACAHQYFFHMTVKRLHESPLLMIKVSVQHDNHIAPAWPAVTRQEEQESIIWAVNRINIGSPKSLLLTADSVQIVTEMMILVNRCAL